MGYKGTTKYNGKFLVDQVIGEWTVIDSRIHTDREAKVLCRCKCGIVKHVSAYNLINGKSKCCIKCVGATRTGNNNVSWRGVGHIPGSKINSSWSLEFTLFLSDLIEKQNFKCALTGLPISFRDNTASPDRIDSSKGYENNNVHWVHKDVNVMKNGFEMEYFIKMCHIVARNNEEPSDLIETKFVFGR